MENLLFTRYSHLQLFPLFLPSHHSILILVIVPFMCELAMKSYSSISWKSWAWTNVIIYILSFFRSESSLSALENNFTFLARYSLSSVLGRLSTLTHYPKMQLFFLFLSCVLHKFTHFRMGKLLCSSLKWGEFLMSSTVSRLLYIWKPVWWRRRRCYDYESVAAAQKYENKLLLVFILLAQIKTRENVVVFFAGAATE